VRKRDFLGGHRWLVGFVIGFVAAPFLRTGIPEIVVSTAIGMNSGRRFIRTKPLSTTVTERMLTVTIRSRMNSREVAYIVDARERFGK